jgi:DNA repair exonuclease SbcCD ATPase subunit
MAVAGCGTVLPHFRHEFCQKMNGVQSMRCGVPSVTSAVCESKWRLLLAGALLLYLVGAPACAFAQDTSSSAELQTADDEFSRQLSELKRTFADLSKKFDDSAQSIDRLNSAEAARKEIEELRADVAKLLAAVADNGTVWGLGTRALSRAEEKLKALEHETRFKQEDRQFLIERWRELRGATEDAIKELESARKEFAELLRKLQTNEDFIDELLQIREHQRALEVIHTLTSGIRDASDKLKKLLSTIRTPGA